MKNILRIIPLVILLYSSACKKFIDVNQDPNNPTTVQSPLILAPVELAISHQLNGGFAAVLAQHYTQTVCLNQPVPHDGTYFLVNSQMDGDWNNLYTTMLQN